MKFDIETITNSMPVGIAVYIHDGGFFEGDKSETRNQKFVKVINEKGYTVINANHRLEEYPTPVEDILNIITYYRDKTDNLLVIGESSGGYLGLIASLIMQVKNNKSANKIICISTLPNFYSNLVTNNVSTVISKFNKENNKLACPTYYINTHNIKLQSSIEFIHSNNDFIDINIVKNFIKNNTNSCLHIVDSVATNNPHGISDDDICNIIARVL
tara:strand:- start:10329 stop:10973 length:645 start_codon:yes stop_codon:yes gene_type:complete